MPQSPRLLQGDHGTAGGPGPTNPLLARPPATPHRPKSGAALEALILDLENKYRLGLKVRGDTWSPRKTAGVETIADKVYGQIKRLFFSARPALDSALERFCQTAIGFEHHKQLELLHGVLKSITHSPISRTGTPLNEPPKSMRSVPPCKCPFASGSLTHCVLHYHPATRNSPSTSLQNGYATLPLCYILVSTLYYTVDTNSH
jgi:hypothetical protein